MISDSCSCNHLVSLTKSRASHYQIALLIQFVKMTKGRPEIMFSISLFYKILHINSRFLSTNLIGHRYYNLDSTQLFKVNNRNTTMPWFLKCYQVPDKMLSPPYKVLSPSQKCWISLFRTVSLLIYLEWTTFDRYFSRNLLKLLSNSSL